MDWDTFKRGNHSTVGGDGGCRSREVRAGTTSPMPDHKAFKLQQLSEIHPLTPAVQELTNYENITSTVVCMLIDVKIWKNLLHELLSLMKQLWIECSEVNAKLYASLFYTSFK